MNKKINTMLFGPPFKQATVDIIPSKHSYNRKEVINEFFGYCEVNSNTKYTIDKEKKSDYDIKSFYKL